MPAVAISNSGFLFFLDPAAKSGRVGFCSSFKASLSLALRLFITPSKSKITSCSIISSILRCIHGRPICQGESISSSPTVTIPLVAISAILWVPLTQNDLACPFSLLMSWTRANAQLFNFNSGFSAHNNAT